MEKKEQARKRVFARVCAEDLQKLNGGATVTILSPPEDPGPTISEAATSETIPDER